MKLGEKIINLRKNSNLSQEELSEQIGVSRQSISKWENGSSSPDASNILALSKLFNVSADYLINDDIEDIDEKEKMQEKDKNIKDKIPYILLMVGSLGNFAIYLASRFIKVLVPRKVLDESGKMLYEWRGDLKGYSYKYFIQNYNLELIVAMLYLVILFSIIIIIRKRKMRRYQ